MTALTNLCVVLRAAGGRYLWRRVAAKEKFDSRCEWRSEEDKRQPAILGGKNSGNLHCLQPKRDSNAASIGMSRGISEL
jgi:hypothetical protein